MTALTDTLTTNTRIMTVWICDGEQAHLTTGLTLLRAGGGYVCPQCGKPVTDCTDAPIGREYFGWLRPDLWRQ